MSGKLLVVPTEDLTRELSNKEAEIVDLTARINFHISDNKEQEVELSKLEDLLDAESSGKATSDAKCKKMTSEMENLRAGLETAKKGI